MPGEVLAVTGHRPNKLGGYSAAVALQIARLAKSTLRGYQPSMVITGMALGWDLEIAQAAADLRIPFIAAIPFEGQEARWSESEQQRYIGLLRRAQHIELVSLGKFTPEKYHARNRWMVDNAQRVTALWDPKERAGGTYQTVQYAKFRKIQCDNLWPIWVSIAPNALTDTSVIRTW